jgi:SAM-dependent methyltransferase
VTATFEELVADAVAQPARWDFSYLAGRAIEERPSWRYFDRVADAARAATRLLDVETGVGNLLADLPVLPPLAVGTDAYPPSLRAASARLRDRGAAIVGAERSLPFADGTFDLVVSRHPVETPWSEVARCICTGGRFVSQQVGSHSVRDLSEWLMGPLPPSTHRDPAAARLVAERAGFAVDTLIHERPRTTFFDIGAVVYFLRVVVWIVPDFSVDRYEPELRTLHEHIEATGSFETTSSRFLIEATRA